MNEISAVSEEEKIGYAKRFLEADKKTRCYECMKEVNAALEKYSCTISPSLLKKPNAADVWAIEIICRPS